MSENFFERSLGQWLSPQVGKEPPEEVLRRKPSGFLRPFGASPPQESTHDPVLTGVADSAERLGLEHPPTADPLAAAAARVGLSREMHSDELEAFRDIMTAFREHIMYAFPNIQALDADQLMLAAGWLADAEAQVLAVRLRATMFSALGMKGFINTVEAALRELRQLKQVLALQQKRVVQENRERIAAINREAETTARRMRDERHRVLKEANDYTARLHEETMRRRREASDRSHEEFMRYIRGEQVIGYIKMLD